MRHLFAAAAIASGLAAGTAPAQAAEVQFFGTGDLMARCDGIVPRAPGQCMAYILGVTDTLTLTGPMLGGAPSLRNPFLACRASPRRNRLPTTVLGKLAHLTVGAAPGAFMAAIFIRWLTGG